MSRRKNADLIDLVGLPARPLHAAPAQTLDLAPPTPLPVPARTALPKSAPLSLNQPRAHVPAPPPRTKAPSPAPPVPVAAVAPVVPALAPPALVLPEPMPVLPPKNTIDSAFMARIDARPPLTDAPVPPPRPVESQPPRADVAEVRAAPFTPADPSVNATMRLEPPRIIPAQRHSGTELPADASLATGAIAPVRINYVVRNQPLDHVLREIGHLAGINVVASSGIRVTLREKRLDGTADRIFDQLARDHALFWFLDGTTAYVDPLDQQKTRFFKVKGASQAVLARAIDAAGLGKYRDRIQLSGKDGLVRVSGPDTFTRTVESALASTEVDSTTINVIRFGQKGH